MKPITFNTGKIEIILVEVPEDAKAFFINNVGCIRYLHNKDNETTPILPEQLGIYATNDNCIILGKIIISETGKKDFDFDWAKLFGLEDSNELNEDDYGHCMYLITKSLEDVGYTKGNPIAEDIKRNCVCKRNYENCTEESEECVKFLGDIAQAEYKNYLNKTFIAIKKN